MDTSLVLAKFFGVYLIVMGLYIAMRPKDAAKLMDAFKSNLALRYLMGVLALVFGLVLVLMHNVWVGTYEVVISILSWGVLIKGVMILLTPESIFSLGKTFGAHKNLTVASGIVLVLGAYLAYVGFFV